MPSREELLSKLLGTMQAPLCNRFTLNEAPTKFVRDWLRCVTTGRPKRPADIRIDDIVFNLKHRQE